MNFEITGVAALEILDSRGRPTLQTTVTLADGTTAVAGVPSGAATAPGRRSSCATATPPDSAGQVC
jgi:enolase